MKDCHHIWWTPHIIPGQTWCEGEEPYCPLERQICILEPDHEGDHKSKTGETQPREEKEVRTLGSKDPDRHRRQSRR